MSDHKRAKLILQLNLVLVIAGGSLVLLSFLKEPSEPGSAVFLGFSYLRLAVVLMLAAILVAALSLLLGSAQDSSLAVRMENGFTKLAGQKWIFWLCIAWIAVSYISLFLSDTRLGSLGSYRERLYPLLLWFALLSVQFGLSVISFRGVLSDAGRAYRGVLVASLLMFILFGLLLLGIKVTRIGLTPDRIYWQAPGAPLLLQQVAFAAIAGVLLHSFLERTNLNRSRHLDRVLFLGLWVFTFLVWWNEPADFTWFSLEPTPPNYQSYPFSDALLYDGVAREYLIGKPIPSDFWAKPVYSLMLAIVHLFAGGDYALLVSLQVLILAFIPAIAYLLGTRLAGRPAGLVLALMLLLREQNALALSNVIQVSHVKLLLSDVFAMGLMVLLVWLFFQWYENPEGRRVTLLILGGVLSLLVLTRGHPLVLLPLVLCAVFLVPTPRARLRWGAVALTFLGFLLPFLPWLWRNYELTGGLALRHSVSIHSGPYSLVYSAEPSGFGPGSLPPKLPGESDVAYYNRLQAQAMRFILEHPDEVAKFTSAHFFHNLISSYIYLPYSFEIQGIKEYVHEQPFWGTWTGNLSWQASILLFVHLSLISLGLGYLWEKYRYFAFFPLFLGVGYNLSISIARVSGWRFILPADWITLVYYAVGLMYFYEILRVFFTRQTSPVVQADSRPVILQHLQRTSLVGFAIFFISIGLMLTKGHGLFSQRYPVKSTSQLKDAYSALTRSVPMPSSPRDADLEEILRTEGAVIVYGQALNPSFLAADKEDFDNSWPVYYFWPHYRPQTFPRLIFNLNGPESAGVVLPMQAAPASFADGSDVIVIGCWAKTGEINALAVLVQGDTPLHYSSEPFRETICLSSSE